MVYDENIYIYKLKKEIYIYIYTYIYIYEASGAETDQSDIFLKLS